MKFLGATRVEELVPSMVSLDVCGFYVVEHLSGRKSGLATYHKIKTVAYIIYMIGTSEYHAEPVIGSTLLVTIDQTIQLI